MQTTIWISILLFNLENNNIRMLGLIVKWMPISFISLPVCLDIERTLSEQWFLVFMWKRKSMGTRYDGFFECIFKSVTIVCTHIINMKIKYYAPKNGNRCNESTSAIVITHLIRKKCSSPNKTNPKCAILVWQSTQFNTIHSHCPEKLPISLQMCEIWLHSQFICRYIISSATDIRSRRPLSHARWLFMHPDT